LAFDKNTRNLISKTVTACRQRLTEDHRLSSCQSLISIYGRSEKLVNTLKDSESQTYCKFWGWMIFLPFEWLSEYPTLRPFARKPSFFS